MKIVQHDALRKEIVRRLYDDQSPEAIAGHIRRNRTLPAISKDAIYRFIASVYGRWIEAYRLRRRTRCHRRHANTAVLTSRRFIDQRPKHIEQRRHIGDVEADFVVSGRNGRGILLVAVDRRSRAAFLELIIRGTIERVHRAFQRIKKRFPEMRTVTTDNDILFAQHERLAATLNIYIFFCHPYHSWEKGTVENTNKVIRKDIPKGSDLSRYSKRFIESLEAKLNRRPMKCLEYRTPQEVLAAHRNKRNKKTRS